MRAQPIRAARGPTRIVKHPSTRLHRSLIPPATHSHRSEPNLIRLLPGAFDVDGSLLAIRIEHLELDAFSRLGGTDCEIQIVD